MCCNVWGVMAALTILVARISLGVPQGTASPWKACYPATVFQVGCPWLLEIGIEYTTQSQALWVGV